MAEQMRPSSKENAPDPANSYERTNPDREAGMGRVDAPKSTPTDQPESGRQAVGNEQNPTRQVNAQDASTAHERASGAAEQPNHSMKEEEPLGWDQAPMGRTEAERKRHSRTEGKGGVE